MKFKASQLKVTWDNFFVCSKCFEHRHPQDFVRGKKDKQRVPISRPDVVVQNKTTTLAAAHAKDQAYLNVASISSIVEYTPLVVQIGYGGTIYFATYSTTTPAVSTYVPIAEPLPYAGDSGNTVLIPANSDEYLAIGDVTATDFDTR
jgi:hypothetical protein